MSVAVVRAGSSETTAVPSSPALQLDVPSGSTGAAQYVPVVSTPPASASANANARTAVAAPLNAAATTELARMVQTPTAASRLLPTSPVAADAWLVPMRTISEPDTDVPVDMAAVMVATTEGSLLRPVSTTAPGRALTSSPPLTPPPLAAPVAPAAAVAAAPAPVPAPAPEVAAVPLAPAVPVIIAPPVAKVNPRARYQQALVPGK